MKRMILFPAIAIAAFAASFEVASVKPSAPAFEVVSLKYAGQIEPGRVPHGNCELKGNRVMCEETLGFFIARAFGVKHWEYAVPPPGRSTPVILNGLGIEPYWVDLEFYQVNAVAPSGTTEAMKNLMLQTMLEQRLGLRYHYEDRQTPVYDLTIAKSGVKLKPAIPKDDPHPADSVKMSMAAFKRDAVTLDDFAAGFLTNHVDRPVLNMTGLTGEYRIALDWSEEMKEMGGNEPGLRGVNPAVISASLHRLGLNFESKKANVKTLVIDHLNRDPLPN